MKYTVNKLDDSYLNDFQPLEVVVGDDIMDAIKRFRGLVTKERVMSSIKEHYAYEKPSDKKRRKMRESLQRVKKAAYMAKIESRHPKKSTDEDQFNNG